MPGCTARHSRAVLRAQASLAPTRCCRPSQILEQEEGVFHLPQAWQEASAEPRGFQKESPPPGRLVRALCHPLSGTGRPRGRSQPPILPARAALGVSFQLSSGGMRPHTRFDLHTQLAIQGRDVRDPTHHTCFPGPQLPPRLPSPLGSAWPSLPCSGATAGTSRPAPLLRAPPVRIHPPQ